MSTSSKDPVTVTRTRSVFTSGHLTSQPTGGYYWELGTRTRRARLELLPWSSSSQVSPSFRPFSAWMSAHPVTNPLKLGVHRYSTGQCLVHGSSTTSTFLPCFFLLGRTGSRQGNSWRKNHKLAALAPCVATSVRNEGYSPAMFDLVGAPRRRTFYCLFSDTRFSGQGFCLLFTREKFHVIHLLMYTCNENKILFAKNKMRTRLFNLGYIMSCRQELAVDMYYQFQQDLL
jgi:hypothetical protein